MSIPVTAEDTAEGRSVGFWGHNTHVERHGGRLIFLNYRCNHIYITHDSSFVDFFNRHSLKHLPEREGQDTMDD
jgi:hypothetical protein